MTVRFRSCPRSGVLCRPVRSTVERRCAVPSRPLPCSASLPRVSNRSQPSQLGSASGSCDHARQSLCDLGPDSIAVGGVRRKSEYVFFTSVLPDRRMEHVRRARLDTSGVLRQRSHAQVQASGWFSTTWRSSIVPSRFIQSVTSVRVQRWSWSRDAAMSQPSGSSRIQPSASWHSTR